MKLNSPNFWNDNFYSPKCTCAQWGNIFIPWRLPWWFLMRPSTLKPGDVPGHTRLLIQPYCILVAKSQALLHSWSFICTHSACNFCTISIGFTQHDNCTIAIVNIIKAEVPSCSHFWVYCTTEHSFATQTQKMMEISRNKQRDLQLIYGRDITCKRSILIAESFNAMSTG